MGVVPRRAWSVFATPRVTSGIVDSAQSDGRPPMNQVPIVRVTEMLLSTFGIAATRVKPRRNDGGNVPWRFDVTDDACRSWQLTVSCRPPAGLPRSARHVHHRGRHWTLVPEPGGDQRPVEILRSPGSSGEQVQHTAPACTAPSADSRALERVGSWLAQPAGLPTATDIPGQSFVQLWARHRSLIGRIHLQAERRHDARCRDPGAQPLPCGEGIDAPAAALHLLRVLVDCQATVLGPQAAVYPIALRRACLRRLQHLLEAESARQGLGGPWWMAS